MKKLKIKVINGPNLNMLGIREPGIYGNDTYKSLVKSIKDYAKANQIKVCCVQSNHEGTLVSEIQKCHRKYDGIVINPGAYTHTSIAILDAAKAVHLPIVEVHISKVEEREEFRQISFIRSACVKTITGHGLQGYLEALAFLKENSGESK